MSLLSQLFSAVNEPRPVREIRPAGSILSATGLNRRILAELFRRNGLFGAESDLAPVEQAIVQSRLGPLPGIRPPAVLAPTDARLVALENFTDAVQRAGGVATGVQRRQLAEAGFGNEQIREVIQVVRNSIDVFGSRRAPTATATDASTANDSRYAQAA